MKIKEIKKTKKVFKIDKKRMSEFLQKNYTVISKSKFQETFAHPSYKKLQNKFLDIVNGEILLGYQAYEMKIYPLAVYHLQQSVEKLVKGWLLSYGATYEELRNTSHNTFALFMNLFKLNSSQIIEISDVYGKKNIVSELLQKIDIFHTSRSHEIATLSKKEIDFFLQKLDAIYTKSDFSSETLEEWYDGLHDLFKDLPENKFEIDKESLKQTLGPNFFAMFYNYQASFLALFVLSFLTYSHDMWSRYPKDPVKLNQNLEYDEYIHGLGIVDRTLRLLDLCSKCKDHFTNFNIKEIEENIARLKFVFY